MLDLILLILLIWAFVRFYKSLSSGTRAFTNQINSEPGRNARSQFSQGRKRKKSFDDIEEAEYVEIKEKDKNSSDSHSS